jgi:hypothetical protein
MRALRRPPSPRRLAIGCAWLGPASSLKPESNRSCDGFPGLRDLEYGEGAASASLDAAQTLAILVTAWSQPLGRLWRIAVVEAQRRGAGWCLLFNGVHLRLVDARRVYSRRFADLDLDAAADEPAVAAALWVLCGAPSFAADPDGQTPIARLVAGSERHGAGVCRNLRTGVLEASQDVMGAMIARRPHDPLGAFEQALTVVYRILFLLFAEARRARADVASVYRQSYSIEALREAPSVRRRLRDCGTHSAR